ncbi:unnamed protein product [Spirodela intermedia]|uniref:Peptidase A1 domain-containing protein n=1 Tax=Spirodela intermedia TaxID=51605 RepID=A0A7I8ITH5_SPIIN|nr:unnamed protein product [Spirodela intermedia]CAA6661105.1 unnamed protein product [Spirodela intermedia]
MVANPRLDTFYYVELVGISVGGARVPGVLAADLRLDPATGKGGVIVDSGTSVTRLARPAYTALRDAFRAGTAGLKPAASFSLFETCYDLSGMTEVKVPKVVMHFRGAGGRAAVADLALPAENYLIPVATNAVFCFAFAGTDSGISIIGNIQQQGFRVVFDGAGSRVGFAPALADPPLRRHKKREKMGLLSGLEMWYLSCNSASLSWLIQLMWRIIPTLPNGSHQRQTEVWGGS